MHVPTGFRYGIQSYIQKLQMLNLKQVKQMSKNKILITFILKIINPISTYSLYNNNNDKF